MTTVKTYNPWILATARIYNVPAARIAQLIQLADDEGFLTNSLDTESSISAAEQCNSICVAFDAWVQHMVSDSAVPGLCTRCGTSSGEVEPDARGYDCDECGTPTVASPLVLLGLI